LGSDRLLTGWPRPEMMIVLFVVVARLAARQMKPHRD
jgi:hypothetical protein